MARVIAIAAIGKNRELGKGNDLLWKIPDDLKRFKELTKGHPVVMGRKTFQSIGRPLPGRTNIVVTRNLEYTGLRNPYMESVVVVSSIEGALAAGHSAPGGEKIFIIGGGEIYAQALPFTDELYLTLIDDTKEADSFFPAYESYFQEKQFVGEGVFEGVKYSWVNFVR